VISYGIRARRQHQRVELDEAFHAGQLTMSNLGIIGNRCVVRRC
jgi:hypothetical protein